MSDIVERYRQRRDARLALKADGGKGSGKPKGYGGGKKEEAKGTSSSTKESSTPSTLSFNHKSINDNLNKEITRNNNGGGSRKETAKAYKQALNDAPIGTVVTETHERGMKFKYTKTGEDEWTMSGDKGYKSTARELSSSPLGNSTLNEVSFSAPDNAPTDEHVKESQLNGVNGQLNQWLRGGEAKRRNQ